MSCRLENLASHQGVAAPGAMRGNVVTEVRFSCLLASYFLRFGCCFEYSFGVAETDY